MIFLYIHFLVEYDFWICPLVFIISSWNFLVNEFAQTEMWALSIIFFFSSYVFLMRFKLDFEIWYIFWWKILSPLGLKPVTLCCLFFQLYSVPFSTDESIIGFLWTTYPWMHAHSLTCNCIRKWIFSEEFCLLRYKPL